MRDGMNPASTLSAMLMKNMTTHCHHDTCMSPLMPSTAASMTLPIAETATAISTPIAPEYAPSIADSAMNTRDISFLRAPRLLSTPIYFLRSSSEVYMMMAIMMVETMSEMAAKPTSTCVTVELSCSTNVIIMAS